MFSGHYLGLYIAVVGVIVISALLWLGLYVQQRRVARQHSLPAGRPGWAATPEDGSA